MVAGIEEMRDVQDDRSAVLGVLLEVPGAPASTMLLGGGLGPEGAGFLKDVARACCLEMPCQVVEVRRDRDMDMRGVNSVVKVVVRHDDTVDAIFVLCERNGRDEWTDLWGGQGETLSEICLWPEEHFTSVGHYGEFGSFAVRLLTFVGIRRSFVPYGQEDGVPFALPAAGGKILGFHARSGCCLDVRRDCAGPPCPGDFEWDVEPEYSTRGPCRILSTGCCVLPDSPDAAEA